jgi:hypothetical protein
MLIISAMRQSLMPSWKRGLQLQQLKMQQPLALLQLPPYHQL